MVHKSIRAAFLFVLLIPHIFFAEDLTQEFKNRPQNQQLTLSLAQAIDYAIKFNLESYLGRERINQAQGEKGLSLSALLPNLTGSASQASKTANLAALGLNASVFPGIKPFLGPYSLFDARFTLSQTIFDLSAFRKYQAGKYGVELAEERSKFSTQKVITATTLAYLAVLEAEQSLSSAKANVQLAQSLLDLATSQRNAGVATGLDVARAETRLSSEQVQLADVQTKLGTARLDLVEMMGIPYSNSITLTDPMRFMPEDAHDGQAAVNAALTERTDLHAALAQAKIAKSQLQSSAAGYLPTVEFDGDYGDSGITLTNTNLATRSVSIGVNVPIFDGNKTRSDVKVSTSLLRQAQAQVLALRHSIEHDVRQALDNLTTREAQVKAAQKTVDLATRELDLSRDRFRNGVADNIEVVNAQTALEAARLTLVTSLAQFNIARLNLASSMGRVQDFHL